MIRSSKMRKMKRRMHILYSLFFILSNLLSFEIGGRHPTTDIPYKDHTMCEYLNQVNN